jgi:hypothetical protein
MPSKIPAQISQDMHGYLHVHVGSLTESTELFNLCKEHGLGVQGHGTDLQGNWVWFSKDVDEEHLMMILRDRYELSPR